MTSFIERTSMSPPKQQAIVEAEVSTLETLKDLMINDFLKVNNELKDFRQDFRKIDSRLPFIESKLDAFEKKNLTITKGCERGARGGTWGGKENRQ